ncbi:germinal-center associated nuclear protein-like [Centruroides sculpturatus]|uniref:germinal-center associated nuclear protein-like n=1 Tax=Centruroides sculpturatus TaxID=218467 RepID=UPI000C6DF7A5|nr:germinal-center associated nuclear protein-like [Centruroides sculpturatus]
MMEGIEDHKVLQRPEDMDSQKKPEFIIQKQTRKNLTNIEKSGNIKPQIETSEEMLWTLMTSTATTIGERYRILKARDKLLRLRQQKTSDIRKAKAIVGVCPDMCPEKERYNRAEKNCLSIFETSADKLIDHRAVIKEYSRSSADQEEPLPHELRPPDVLIKTMDYLLCNIVDLVNNDQSPGFSIGEWYDFIWNRTRAIRKDITQQHLCGLKSVSLVEKCARFHIHCSAVLCEEDMATFDAKINNENLTKCLQTLKHLYHDLNIQNIQCPQESEFRAYDVLLNINESDILREIQQFPSYIRESEEIKFAISIFNAVNSNNYIKFFRLVRKTTYLNACLLHRYFSQVRIKALHTILKAFCIPNRPEQFPMLELKHILAFESVNDVKEFCQWLGLKSDEKFVILNRSDFVLPTSPLPVSRAYQLIESKRVTNISEVNQSFYFF